MSGVFIAFEGGEGAGKSTQAAILEAALKRMGHRTLLLREPGSTDLGDYLRDYLVDDRPISPLAELLLFEGSRAELIERRIKPGLADGAVIIADRFAGSTFAYQGYGRGIDLREVRRLNDLATGGRYPNLTILLDIHPAKGLGRVSERHLQMVLPFGDSLDRFEDETLAFHDRVRQGFLQQLADNPDSWTVIDGDQSIDDVAAAVWKAVGHVLPAETAAKLTQIDLN